MNLVTDKNYVTMNAVEAILSKPAKHQEPTIWTQRKGFGKTPSYLHRAPAPDQPQPSQGHEQVLAAQRLEISTIPLLACT